MQFLRRSLVGIWLIALTVAGIGWAAVTVYDAVKVAIAPRAPMRAPNETVLTVNVVPVESGILTPVLETYGEIRSRRTLEVRATASGRVLELSDQFEEGGRVEEGDLLMRIDPAAAEADLAIAQADVSEADAELSQARFGLELAQADLEAAQEQADLRAQALERQFSLQERGVGSAAAVEDAALADAAARQSVVSRRQSLAAAEARIELAETTLNRMRVNVTEAQRMLADTELRAGFTGRLSEVNVVEGGLVSENEMLAQLVDPDALEVAVRLSTAQYARLLDEQASLMSMEVAVSMEVAGLDLSTKGQVERESAVVGEGQTGRQVFVRIDATAGFRPGDFVTVRISEPELDNVARLPARAVDGNSNVLVLDDENRLLAAKADVLRRQGNDVLVRVNDAIEGRRVVAEQTPLLGSGIRVRPVQPLSDTDEVTVPQIDEMITLAPEQRQKLIDFVQSSARMPEDVRQRVLAQLEQEQVPASVIQRLESRMGS
ncbi:efflux RND transporter periplasmic adaptor subunit [Qingshengfaniella alkalisoli]|uniref:HlyD family efflux transporter periplasmic adaptor subunit n=1 Tax=Qingshengfaniella alkalisoli TaxID=2599296 RepID=A0A5B8I5G3_9RHOB|nr:HlyD family efflux transporter periplasmic adaptor subunit [Qingshengfaniella alkalisoli]QDY68569.1 HlyD family efflux transporter periplasmic adaptor subunit [Qingshengfaniella alkalisoli]